MGSPSAWSQTSVWGLGRSGKYSRVVPNPVGYRLFSLCSDTCQCGETVETGREREPSVKSHGATLLPQLRRLLLSALCSTITMKPLSSDYASCLTISVIYCYEINILWLLLQNQNILLFVHGSVIWVGPCRVILLLALSGVTRASAIT
jgi:hypothetical protein